MFPIKLHVYGFSFKHIHAFKTRNKGEMGHILQEQETRKNEFCEYLSGDSEKLFSGWFKAIT